MKKPFWMLCILVLLSSLAIPTFANSAEPPAIIVIAVGLPADAELSLEVPGAGEVEFRQCYRLEKLWESQYKLWLPLDLENIENAQLRVTVGEESFTCTIPGDTRDYRKVMTLDYRNQTLTEGQQPWRQAVLTAIRILLTLLTEGFVFWLFGYRKKRSWIVFLVLNLVTQGWLNIVLNGYAFSTGYWIIGFFLMELAIFAVETVVIVLAVSEGEKWKRILFPLVANALSLGLGILLIGNMPL